MMGEKSEPVLEWEEFKAKVRALVDSEAQALVERRAEAADKAAWELFRSVKDESAEARKEAVSVFLDHYETGMLTEPRDIDLVREALSANDQALAALSRIEAELARLHRMEEVARAYVTSGYSMPAGLRASLGMEA